MSDLELQVNELTMQTEYQLRLKDLLLQEKVKELTDKFTNEVDNEKQKFDLLLQVVYPQADSPSLLNWWIKLL